MLHHAVVLHLLVRGVEGDGLDGNDKPGSRMADLPGSMMVMALVMAIVVEIVVVDVVVDVM